MTDYSFRRDPPPKRFIAEAKVGRVEQIVGEGESLTDALAILHTKVGDDPPGDRDLAFRAGYLVGVAERK